MRIMWTPAAAGDLEQITDYLYEQAPEIADDLVQRIYSAPSVLKQFPNTGRPGRKPGTRELVITSLPYLIIYSVSGQTIQIHRVLHGARRWPQ
jgi:toxin ParE1/3/4